MLYLVLGCLALAFILSTRGKLFVRRRGLRLLTGAFAVAAFAGAAYLGLRQSWGSAIVLIVVGMGLAVSARRNDPASRADSGEMSLAEARSVLGVGPGANRREIQAAYIRLMRMAHPDHGGTPGLAAQLSAARDRLLRE